MKTTNPSLPLLPTLVIFLLSALAANLLLLDASAVDAPPSYPLVRDTDGDEVMTGRPYYIVSAVQGARRRGLTVACTNETGTPPICPFDVVQTRRLGDRGLPFSFSKYNTSVVQEFMNFIITSPSVNKCGIDQHPTNWVLDYDQSNSENFVKSCAAFKICTVSFKILKDGSVGNSYNILFCPIGCDYPICQYIGIYSDADGTRRLALSNQPLRVVFLKARPRVEYPLLQL